MNDYSRGWDDCLRLIMEILENAKNLKDALKKVDYLKNLVEERRFILTYERIKTELGIFKDLF